VTTQKNHVKDVLGGIASCGALLYFGVTVWLVLEAGWEKFWYGHAMSLAKTAAHAKAEFSSAQSAIPTLFWMLVSYLGGGALLYLLLIAAFFWAPKQWNKDTGEAPSPEDQSGRRKGGPRAAISYEQPLENRIEEIARELRKQPPGDANYTRLRDELDTVIAHAQAEAASKLVDATEGLVTATKGLGDTTSGLVWATRWLVGATLVLALAEIIRMVLGRS
jgi:hypothetical protein